jgi:hypothetical protein
VRTTFEHLSDRLRALSGHHWVGCFVVIAILSWRLISRSPADPDLFARIAMGRLIQTTGSVPLTDPFAFTTKHSQWIDHEWLSGVVFWWILENTGEAGLIAAKLAIAAVTTFFVFCASSLVAPFSKGRFIWVTLCMMHASFLWGSTLRCQVFTYLFLAFSLLAAELCRKRGTTSYLFALPIISVAWINLHGGWALGACTIWLYSLINLFSPSSYGKRALLLSAATFSLAPFFTPYGATDFVTYLFHALQMERPSIEEWAPLFTDRTAFTVTVGIAGVVALGAVIRKPRDLVALSILIFSAYCGFRHIRLLGFFMITCAIYGTPFLGAVCALLCNRFSSFTEKLARATAVTAALLVISATCSTIRYTLQASTWRLDLSTFSYEALRWLAESTERGKLLVDFNNGSIALWMLYPNFQISMDGRYEEVYPTETVRDNARALEFASAEAAQALREIQPTHILASAKARSSLPEGWAVIYSDARSIVLKKNSLTAIDSNNVASSTRFGLWQPKF